MYQVSWQPAAIQELADLWTRADTTVRQAINDAVEQVDDRLERNPSSFGESRGGNNRVGFAFPLVVMFTISSEKSTVYVAHVRPWRRIR